MTKVDADTTRWTIGVRQFATAILHGDDEHRAWLLEAAEAFISGDKLPPPRGAGANRAATIALPSAEEIAQLIFDKAVGEHLWENEFYEGERAGCLETAQAILDRLRCSPDSNWQPIDTAPKDGTEVLVWWPFYKLDDNGDLTDEQDGGARIVANYCGGWQSGDPLEGVGEYFGDEAEPGHEPTLWCPLPDKPTITSGQPQDKPR